MLQLAGQVGNHLLRAGAAVGDHQDLTGAGEAVDADDAEDGPLGQGHEDVAGAGDLVDRGHALGAVGQRGDRLGPANGKDAVDPATMMAAWATAGGMLPCSSGGVVITTSPTPAIRAGIAFIRTVLG